MKQDAQKQEQHRNKGIRRAREETHSDDQAVDRARQLRFARAQVRVRVCLGGRRCVSVYQLHALKGAAVCMTSSSPAQARLEESKTALKALTSRNAVLTSHSKSGEQGEAGGQGGGLGPLSSAFLLGLENQEHQETRASSLSSPFLLGRDSCRWHGKDPTQGHHAQRQERHEEEQEHQAQNRPRLLMSRRGCHGPSTAADPKRSKISKRSARPASSGYPLIHNVQHNDIQTQLQ